ncbi:hypothetical protein D3C81_856010 [compost metagenome]
MDALARAKLARAARPLHAHVAACLQVHLDARRLAVEAGHVAPVRQHEVGADDPVHVAQQIAVEGGRDAQRIVVGGHQRGLVLVQVDTDQHAIAAPGHAAQPLQQRQRFHRGEIADARARVEEQPPAAPDVARQVERRAQVGAEPQHRDAGMLLLQRRQRRAQEIDGDIEGHVLRRPQAAEQARGLLAIAGAQVHQHAAAAGTRRDGGGGAGKDGCLGARRVVLWQVGDRLEQARAQHVVEELGTDRRRLGTQPGQQLPAQRAAVLAILLHELGLWRRAVRVAVGQCDQRGLGAGRRRHGMAVVVMVAGSGLRGLLGRGVRRVRDSRHDVSLCGREWSLLHCVFPKAALCMCARRSPQPAPVLSGAHRAEPSFKDRCIRRIAHRCMPAWARCGTRCSLSRYLPQWATPATVRL